MFKENTNNTPTDTSGYPISNGMEPQDMTTVTKTPSKLKLFIENVVYIALAVALAMLVQHFLVRPFIVNGGSMDPTFATRDYLLIDRLTYRFHAPERGDVVIFKAPPEPGKYFIKRIVGLPGETVSIKGGVVTITSPEHPEGITLKEPFVTHKSADTMTATVPEGQYFVMGDNRSGSFDSRSWGTLPKANISGRALVRLIPLSQIDYLPGKISY